MFEGFLCSSPRFPGVRLVCSFGLLSVLCVSAVKESAGEQPRFLPQNFKEHLAFAWKADDIRRLHYLGRRDGRVQVAARTVLVQMCVTVACVTAVPKPRTRDGPRHPWSAGACSRFFDARLASRSVDAAKLASRSAEESAGKPGVQPRHKVPREAYLRTGVIGMGSLACTPAYRAVRAARPGQARAANSGAKAPHSIRTASPVECGRLLALSFEGLSLFSTRGLLALSFEGFLRFRREMVVASAGGAVVISPARSPPAGEAGRAECRESESPAHKSRRDD